MDGGNSRTTERRLQLTVKRRGAGKLHIELEEEDGARREFSSWASLYDYLTRNFPEFYGYLR